MTGNYRKHRPADEIEAELREIDLRYKNEAAQEKWMRESYLRIADEARKKNLWLFDPYDRSWLNPDEFEARYKWWIKGAEAVFARIQLKDPAEYLQKALKKIDEFTMRIVNYERARKK